MRCHADFDDDEPAARITWLRHHREPLERTPLPGTGDTVTRWRTLAALGRADGALARLGEGHLDAIAILHELGGDVRPGPLRGVWAARPELLGAEPAAAGWRLSGTKPWCSGAAGLDRALVTATDPDGQVRLFDVDVSAMRFADDWRPLGMRASDSRTACIDMTVDSDAQIGPPGAYVARPGFGHGGVGVAACWHGLAARLASDLALDSRRDDPHLAAARGRALAAVAASTAALASAGRQIDRAPDDELAARRRAGVVRTAVEHVARTVLDASVQAQGARALCFESAHARAVVDLTVYLGQVHHGADAAHVELVDEEAWWA